MTESSMKGCSRLVFVAMALSMVGCQSYRPLPLTPLPGRFSLRRLRRCRSKPRRSRIRCFLR
jgi:hypothetical protein